MLETDSQTGEKCAGANSQANRLPPPGRVRLRPGAEILEVHDACLHIGFPNHTATFNSVPVVRCLKAILPALAKEPDEERIVRAASLASGVSEGFARYVLAMLWETSCLCRSDSLPSDPLDLFHMSMGDDWEGRREQLALTELQAFVSDRSADLLGRALAAAGLRARLLRLRAGDATNAMAAVLDELARTPALILAWDLPYRSNAARAANDLVCRQIPLLFGACEGMVARIGPFILPGSTACLECLEMRLLSNSVPEENSFATASGMRSNGRISEPAPTHPLFLESMAGLFVLEAAEILSLRPPATLGAFIEHQLFAGTCTRHSVLRAPRCPSCAGARPPRFPWDARFGSPGVKAAAP